MVTRRLAAVAVLDVVGFSRMMAEDEDGTLATLKAHRNDIDPVLLNRGARIVKGTGDGLLVEFPSSVEAVAGALEVQQLMARRNEALPEPRRMMLRIGINAGDVLVDDDGDIYGDTVNIAARLEPQADPMGVCVSGVVHDQSAGRVPAQFDSLGSLTMKNIPHPVPAWRASTGERQAGRGPASAYDRLSVAVLPLNATSSDLDQVDFAEGVTEDLTAMLSHFPGLRVASRSATGAVLGATPDTRRLARELDVTYVVDGAVRRYGQRIRVTAQLAEAESGQQLWAERYDRDLTDVFAVQDEIVSEIAAHIHPRLERRETERIITATPEAMQTWQLLLRANDRASRYTAEDTTEAIRLFRLACERDPRLARAHTGLAMAWTQASFERWHIEDRNPFQEMLHSARAAARISPSEPIAVAVQAMAEAFTGHLETGVHLGEHAVRLGPHNPWVLATVGPVWLYQGDLGRAIATYSEAWRVAQHEMWRYHLATGLAFSHYLDRNYDAALAWISRGLQAVEALQLRVVAVATLGQLGRTDEALTHTRRVLARWPQASVTRLMRNNYLRRDDHRDHYRAGLLQGGLPA